MGQTVRAGWVIQILAGKGMRAGLGVGVVG